MEFQRFRVTNYRNIKDSGWIDVRRITSFVGQNEAGKSNLFDALSRINPFMSKDADYNLDEDWPVDDWGNKGAKELTQVCQAQFTLNADEIADLFESAWEPPASDSDETAEDDEDDEKVSEDEVGITPTLPSAVTLLAVSYYERVPYFFLGPTYDKLGLNNKKVQEWAAENLPKFVYIHDYEMSGSQIELDQLLARKNSTPWNRLSNEDQTILIVLELAKIDLKEFVQKGNSAEGRTTRSFDKKQASAYLSKQFKNLWRQKDVKFELEVDGTTLNIFVEDAGVGMPIRLARRSTGFRWYVSFAWKFTHASRGDYKNCILLLEEPGVHLHYDGQRDLLEVFDQLSEENTVLYTTHLASMVKLSAPEQIRIVEQKDNHTIVKSGIVSSQKAPMAVIETALGLSGDMSGLLGNRQSLIVEGGDDALIIQKLSGLLKAEGRTGLSDRIYLWPAKGAPQTPMYAGFAVGNGWDAGVLLDTDEEGNKAKKKIEELYLSSLSGDARFFVTQIGKAANIGKTDAAIEDLFPDDFYLDCVNVTFGTAIKLTDLSPDGSDMITKRVEHLLIEKYGHKELDKRRVMNQMMQRFDTWRKIEDLPKGTADRAERLFKTINNAFEPEVSVQDNSKETSTATKPKKTGK